MNLSYALIGPPAAGKSTIARQLAQYGVPKIISHTTRPPRSGEKEGVDYHFVDKDTFAKTELIEKITYSGHYYGLSKNEVMSKTEHNPITVLGIERHGFDQLKKLLGKRLFSVFILADENTIIDRVIDLGGDPAAVQERINYAKVCGEFDNWKIADYVVKNTAALDDAVRQVLAIMNLVEPRQLPSGQQTITPVG